MLDLKYEVYVGFFSGISVLVSSEELKMRQIHRHLLNSVCYMLCVKVLLHIWVMGKLHLQSSVKLLALISWSD